MAMNYTLPAILTATVLLAGMFAFIPVEQASTVHTTIQGSQGTVSIDTVDATAVELDDNDEIEITAANAFCVVSMTIEIIAADDNDIFNTDDNEINGVNINDVAGATEVFDFLTDPGGAATFLSDLWVDNSMNGRNAICAEGAEVIEMSIEETGIDIGEIGEITVSAIVDGNVAVDVSLETP